MIIYMIQFIIFILNIELLSRTGYKSLRIFPVSSVYGFVL